MRLVKAQGKSLPDVDRPAVEGCRPKPAAWDGKADPMDWRLPSGKALAEFALEAGFLVPGLLKGRRENQVNDGEELSSWTAKGI